MNHLPLLFDIKAKPCLIIGGGVIGTRRAEKLAQAGAEIHVISVTATPEIEKIAIESGGKIHLRPSQLSDIDQPTSGDRWQLVVAATDDKPLNQQLAERCREHHIPVNVVSDLSQSSFTFPTFIDRDPLTIAVSSGSASPILSRLLAQRIDALIPKHYGQLGALVARFRPVVRNTISGVDERKRFWSRMLTGTVAEQVFSGNREQAESQIERELDQISQQADSSQSTHNKGEVYLIGAGPGDPDLLTFKAYRLLQQAEVVFYDRLVSKHILNQLDPAIELIYVGKQRANHSVPQQEINQLLIDHALQGKRVARLKGGDPFIFGRGGEEIEQLARNQIPFQIVPGITAASGCASYSGIPLTHRDHAQSVRFITGQLQNGTVDLPWNQLVAPNQTVVIYMGLQGLPIICSKLIEHGLNPETPAALIEQGTTLEQKVYCANLCDLPSLIERNVIKPPTLMIIGSVVSLRRSLHWFNDKSNL